MIVFEKSHQNISDNIQFLFKFFFNLIKKGTISGETMRKSGNYIHDYAHSFFGNYF